MSISRTDTAKIRAAYYKAAEALATWRTGYVEIHHGSALNKFINTFDQDDGESYFNDQNERILALCLMAAMVEAGDA